MWAKRTTLCGEVIFGTFHVAELLVEPRGAAAIQKKKSTVLQVQMQPLDATSERDSLI